jgi:hypothetical protein
MIKKTGRFLCIFLLISFLSSAQQKSWVTERSEVFTTYPFSDPDPIPEMGKTYPYFRFDGYTNTPIKKAWKVVILENDYLKIMILPEIGGKIWSTIEKSTGKSFVYYNHTVKFRDVGMRGPWTSGGIEPNYGIIGHTPNTFTPVDYVTVKKADGSVSCIIGVLDLLTRTSWRIDINLPKDKAYITTSSFWYNASAFEQPYYTWMNTGLKAKGNLQFIYPGSSYLGHSGEFSDWPINKENGKDLSYYENNDFGGPKSYHVFGKYTDFFGAYYHDEDFGMGRYSSHDDKAGKKIWIWGLSNEGMIWEKLLTDNDGQYVEVQSGRSFNQAAEQSTFTPFKHKGFMPKSTDTWTEYWFPVLKTKGFVAANNYGALNLKQDNGFLKIYFSPLQKISDKLIIKQGGHIIYSKDLRLNTLQLFKDSTRFNAADGPLAAELGKESLRYEQADSANLVSRPIQAPKDFDWNSVYGLYLKGKENIRQRYYIPAAENLQACLRKDPYYVPALSALSMVMYRNMQYDDALVLARRALSIDSYDEEANYYYGIINNKLGNITDAKDGFDIAAMGTEYRSAAYTALSGIYSREQQHSKAIAYARKAIAFNQYAIDAYQLLALTCRLQNNRSVAAKVLDSLLQYDPLNHFARFEKYLLNPIAETKKQFTSYIKNELPVETYLELAAWYYNNGRNADATRLLKLAPANAEVLYWLAFLENKPLDITKLKPDGVFPFRPETAEVLKKLSVTNKQWLLKYHLALIEWNCNNTGAAAELYQSLGSTPDYAPFYASRAKFNMKNDTALVLADLQKAAAMDKDQWRYGTYLVNYFLKHRQYQQALDLAKDYKNRVRNNFVIDMLYARSLLNNKRYSETDALLKTMEILPNEGATGGRLLYKETELMLAVDAMRNSNYSKALEYISAARNWPENLGVGKPYPDAIDERLEDWLEYKVYTKQAHNATANTVLEKILSAKKAEAGSVNELVTAWALQQKGRQDEAQSILADWRTKQPADVYANWAGRVFNGEPYTLPADAETNENYRVLVEFLQLKW